MNSKRDRRLALGDGAVLSLSDAAALLPGRDAQVRQWLHDAGVVRRWLGQDVVVWRDVIESLPEPDGGDMAPTTSPRMRPKARLRRSAAIDSLR
jgi:hypothetical protein